MAFKTKYFKLTSEWQLLLDNTGNKANANNSFYVNKGSGDFAYSNDAPDLEEGMRISAGARIIPVPVNAKLWGKLPKNFKDYEDYCDGFINVDE